MSNKATHFKVWIHVEGLNEEGDTMQGDDHFPPGQLGCFIQLRDALRFKDSMEIITDSVKTIGGFPDDED